MEEGRDGPGGPCMWVSLQQDTGPTSAAGRASCCLPAGQEMAWMWGGGGEGDRPPSGALCGQVPGSQHQSRWTTGSLAIRPAFADHWSGKYFFFPSVRIRPMDSFSLNPDNISFRKRSLISLLQIWRSISVHPLSLQSFLLSCENFQFWSWKQKVHSEEICRVGPHRQTLVSSGWVRKLRRRYTLYSPYRCEVQNVE